MIGPWRVCAGHAIHCHAKATRRASAGRTKAIQGPRQGNAVYAQTTLCMHRQRCVCAGQAKPKPGPRQGHGPHAQATLCMRRLRIGHATRVPDTPRPHRACTDHAMHAQATPCSLTHKHGVFQRQTLIVFKQLSQSLLSGGNLSWKELPPQFVGQKVHLGVMHALNPH